MPEAPQSLYNVITLTATTTEQSFNIHAAGNVTLDKLSNDVRMVQLQIISRGSGSNNKVNLKTDATATADGVNEIALLPGQAIPPITLYVWNNIVLHYIRDSGATSDITFEVWRFF